LAIVTLKGMMSPLEETLSCAEVRVDMSLPVVYMKFKDPSVPAVAVPVKFGDVTRSVEGGFEI
jgi:hypothetical protein